MRRIYKGSVFGALAIGLLALTSCGGGGGGASTGALSVNITDAPVDGAQKVVVQFHGLELQGPSGTTTLYYCPDPATGKPVLTGNTCAQPVSQQLDLLALNSGTSAALLNGYVLPAGQYQWMRLLVDTTPGASYIEPAGTSNMYDLTIPSGYESGLKLNRGFTVPAGGQASFTIDFDLRKSVVQTSSGYILRPTLRIVDNTVVGAIAGTVNIDLTTCASPAVYVYAGQNVTPTDISGAATDPVTTALVDTTKTAPYPYRAAFLEPGDYTVALTCAAASDNPDTKDSGVTFTGTTNVSVSAGTTTVQNF